VINAGGDRTEAADILIVGDTIAEVGPGLAKRPYHVDRFGGGYHGHGHAAWLHRP
jgi:hypothetical protein